MVALSSLLLFGVVWVVYNKEKKLSTSETNALIINKLITSELSGAKYSRSVTKINSSAFYTKS